VELQKKAMSYIPVRSAFPLGIILLRCLFTVFNLRKEKLSKGKREKKSKKAKGTEAGKRELSIMNYELRITNYELRNW
jgi:hypothetical protein